MSNRPDSGLHWLVNNFPWTDDPNDETDKLTNAIHHHCLAAIEYIKELELEVKMLGGVIHDDKGEKDHTDVIILAKNKDEKMKIGSAIHEQLVGNKDYIDNNIILNVDSPKAVQLTVFQEAKPININLRLNEEDK